ncbi:MAG TPA: carbohydrate binding domain-containing protein [Candidatus Acidoferrum sp.]|nr:carbohydrate binding domain-containing protein [Candidatus Acidoferrum sp.]
MHHEDPTRLAEISSPIVPGKFPCFWLGLLALLLVGSTQAQNIPFVLPWNDATPTVTDFSALNAAIGTNRVATDTNGHFTVNGQRLRFLGFDFAGDSPFMPTNNADAVAARLAKFGVNVIRFHHMDAPWAYNGGVLAYTSSSSTNINPAQLDRVHYVVSRLKAHGIYSDINLLVGREYLTGDGLGPKVTGMDWKDTHALGYFYDPALALHKDYATKLLTPTNPYTGLPLARDPAVALVEIINENGLILKWLDGGLDRLPQRYLFALQDRWNTWLAARYTNDAAMLAAWNVISQPLGTNLLLNDAFSNGLAYWNTEQHYNARADFSRTFDFTNGQPAAKIAVTNADTTGWYIQLNQPNLKLASNQVYTISFWAKSSPATNADVAVMRAHDDYIALGYYQWLNLTTNWQFYSNSFQASVTETNARVNFGSMGNELGTFWFADVRLQTGGQIGMLPPGSSLAARTVTNLLYSGDGFTGTQEARRDWLRFLRDLEYAYFDAMVGHVRTNCGYTGLIFGTIMACSPATVQSRLDVIDGHAYWQHPQFPGVPWDPVNWFQPNLSMVNTVGDDNTLASLARQRIKGKPFTVTEYEHPAPNYHGAESPLLLAAYAGLQDWDGLWLFAYGPGNDMSPMGFVPSYFEIAQHPTKMANLLLAANLFRRGDVRPAAQEITMALTPDRELDLLQNTWAWNLFSSSQLGVPSRLAFTNRLSTSVGTNATGLTTPPPAPAGTVLTSDTGELQWDLSRPNNGLVTADTARTKALIGFADNRSVALNQLTFQPGTTQLGWCTLGATLVRGEVFTNDCTAIVVAGGWWENTGQVWTDTNKISVGTQWGQAPVLTEVVPFTLTLPVGTNYVQAWSLDERGQRKAALLPAGNSTATTLAVTTGAGSIWYEFDVSRWTASFDLWRLRYFNATQLADPAISSAAAKPDGDGVANLLKYYFGLPGGAPAPAGQLPTGALISVSDQSYLAMTYYHDKLVNDVDCIPEVSSNLVNWVSGPTWTEVEQTVDQGVREQITVRDLTPAAGAQQRFMRLRFQPH